MDYRRMYHIVLLGAEKALEALETQNYGLARPLLIAAEEEAEEMYLSEAEEASEEGGEEQRPYSAPAASPSISAL